MQSYEYLGSGLFQHGMKVGAAGWFVGDIDLWMKRRGEVSCNENNRNPVSFCCSAGEESPTGGQY